MAKAPAGIGDLDWDNLSDDQLKEVMRQAKERRSARFEQKVEEFREYAREEGFEVTLTPIGQSAREEPREEPRRRRKPTASERKQDKRSRVVIPKFQNPDNPGELWSGRGIEPKWLKEKQAQGYEKSEFLIHYRNPDDPSETWTWEGKNSKTPAWLMENMDQGLDPLRFAIPPEERGLKRQPPFSRQPFDEGRFWVAIAPVASTQTEGAGGGPTCRLHRSGEAGLMDHEARQFLW